MRMMDSSSDFEIWDNIPHNTTPHWKKTSFEQLATLPGQQQVRLSKQQTSRSLMTNNDHHNQFGSIPIEFIQVLIHQHAKTLVALQDLKNEVKTLKSDSSSSPPSVKPLGSSSGLLSTQLVVSSSQDSGFTEKSKVAAGTSSSEDSDAGNNNDLYSLLSLIHFKVESLSSKNVVATASPPAATAAAVLGTLDVQLGNVQFDFSKFTKMSRSLIRAVLNCNDNTELKRQLLFTIARLKTLEDRHHHHQQSVSLTTTVVSSEASSRSSQLQLESLKSENASLRTKLQNMEIELEGTNAKLRILSKKSTSHNNYHKSRTTLPLVPSPPTPLHRHIVTNPTEATTTSPAAAATATVPPPAAVAAAVATVREKSLSSFGGGSSSSAERANRSLIPVPVARVKKKNQKQNNNFWINWFSSSGANNNNNTNNH